MSTDIYRINHQIKAVELRVIGADGKQIGVLPLKSALEEASKAGLTLVEIAPKANPPVAKIVDLGKFKYQEEKKARQNKKPAGGVKEIRFSPFIAQNDYETRLNRVQQFLDDGNKVRVVVVFKGRELGSRQFGYGLIDKVVKHFGDSIVIDMEPKFLGRHLTSVISPLKKKTVNNVKTESA